MMTGVPSPLLICDVEGCEDGLLDPALTPSRADILVELHDFIVPGVSETLRARFESSHLIQLIHQQPRSRDEFPWRTVVTTLLPRSYQDWAVSEWRPVPMSWLYMRSKANHPIA